MHFADFVGCPGVEQHPLGEGRFTRIHVGDDTDVAESGQIWGDAHFSFLSLQPVFAEGFDRDVWGPIGRRAAGRSVVEWAMADDKLKKYRGEMHEGDARSSPYPVNRLAPAFDLVDVAREISQADAMVNTRVSAKLKVIADQIKALQAEARAVLEEARQDQELHRVPCNFQRRPGTVYHLYRRPDGSRYFSLLSPGDWRDSPPHESLGSYLLENDLSWTPAEDIGKDDDTREIVNRLLLRDE